MSKQYKVYRETNYIRVIDTTTNELFNGTVKDVFVDKSNTQKNIYRLFNVKDLAEDTVFSIPDILKANGSAYSVSEWEAFYTENTGNFNGGGTAPTNLSYTPSPTQGTVTSDTGTDATIPLADGTNAGLLKPTKFTVLENTSGVNTGDQDLSGKANINSPTFTGTPTAPTAIAGTNTTQIATTAFVAGGLAIKENAFSKNTAFNKNFGLNTGDIVGATTLLNQYSTTPVDWTATAFNSGQVVFYGGKQWIAKMATVAEDVPAVSSKWEEITFEALANKTVIVDQTIIDGSTNAVSGNAVFDGLASKADSTLAGIVAALGYTPANDVNVLHKAETETVTGAKTFTNLFSLNYNDTQFANNRPVAWEFRTNALPSSPVTQFTDFHGVDLIAETTSSNVTSETALFGFESAAWNRSNSNMRRLVPVYSLADNNGTGSVDDLTGVQIRLRNTGGGAVTNMYGTMFQTPVNTGTINTIVANEIQAVNGGTANNIGIRIGNVSGATNNFALYTNAGLVQFNDKLGIGKKPTVPLDVLGNASFTGTNATLNIQDGVRGLAQGVTSTSGYIGTFTNHDFILNVSSSPKFKIFTTGNIVVKNGGTLTDAGFGFDSQGTTRLNSTVTLGTSPTTSAGTYDILTRNSSTGVVEKVARTTFATTDSPSFTGAPTAPTATAGTNTTQIATTAFVQANSRPYKVYTALLTQSGTNAPTATVLENTLGGTVVWSREAAGFYNATLVGAFTLNKTTVLITQGTGQAIYSGYGDSLTNHIKLIGYSFSGTQIDNLLDRTTIEIRVYN